MIVSDEAFAYLSVQRGRISNLRHDRKAWLAAYEASLAADMETLAPWLPERCEAVLDVGGGLSGIGILLSRQCDEAKVTILDGVDDPPKVELHRKTFSSARAAYRFWADNGLELDDYISPDPAAEWEKPPPFDLVISLGAWCFHFAPELYLHQVRAAAKPGAVVILDVRNGKTDWTRTLNDRLTFVGVAREAEKFTRMVFRV